jgi:hypothetical protein
MKNLVILIAFLMLCPKVYSDGIYMPSKAYAIPNITAQRALISHKDGVEHLVISSALDSEAQELGWVIPLPSPPTSIEEAEAGILEMISAAAHPNIIHDLGPGGTFILLLFFASMVYVFSTKRSFVEYLVWAAFFLFFVMLSGTMMTLGSEKSLSSPSTELLKTFKAGNYTIRVLNADSYGALNHWLEDNQLSSLPQRGEDIVKKYIQEGWCFAVIKLTRRESGNNAPHPISIQFKTSKPIYPMRLTSLSAKSPKFELYVVTDSGVETAQLKKEFCDKFTFKREHLERSRRIAQHLRGDNFKTYLVDSDKNIFWDQCVVTKFSGVINPESMIDDIVFHSDSYSPLQRTFYSSEARVGQFFILLLYSVFTGYVFFMVTRKRIKVVGLLRKYRLNGLTVACGLSLCSALYASQLEIIEDFKVERLAFIMDITRVFSLHDNLRELPNLDSLTESEIEEELLKRISADDHLEFQDTKIGIGPNGFKVKKKAGKIQLIYYSIWDGPVIEELDLRPH